MVKALPEYRCKVYKYIHDNVYISIDEDGNVGFNWMKCPVKDIEWQYGHHQHWLERDGKLKNIGRFSVVLDYSVPEDLENV